MFFSQLFLSKKGILAPIWLAAHLEKKLRKSQIYETNIPSTVDNIIHPEVPIALRLSGHLLLGVSRIYSRKVSYLYTDCNDMMLRIKQAFSRREIDLPPESATASYAAVTMPERYEQLEELTILPEPRLTQGFTGDNVTTREQITLPDVAPSVFDDLALGSYEPDERLPPADDFLAQDEREAAEGAANVGDDLMGDGFLPPADFDLDAPAPQAEAGGQEAEEAQAEGAQARAEEEAVEVEVMRAEAPGSEARAEMLSPDLALRPASGSEGPAAGGFPEWAEETPGGAEGESGGKRKAPASAGPSSAGIPSVSPGSPGAFVTPELQGLSPSEGAPELRESPKKRARTEAEAAAEAEAAGAGAGAGAEGGAVPAGSAGEMPPPPPRRPPRPQRKRARPAIDSTTCISSEQMRQQLASADDIVVKRRRAPSTREELQAQRLEGLSTSDYFRTPLFPGLNPRLSALCFNLAPEPNLAAVIGGEGIGGTPSSTPGRAERGQRLGPGEEEGEPEQPEAARGGAAAEAVSEGGEGRDVSGGEGVSGAAPEGLGGAGEGLAEVQGQEQASDAERGLEAPPSGGVEAGPSPLLSPGEGDRDFAAFEFEPQGVPEHPEGTPLGALAADGTPHSEKAGAGAGAEEGGASGGRSGGERQAPAQGPSEEEEVYGGRFARVDVAVDEGPGGGLDVPGLVVYKPDAKSLEFLKDASAKDAKKKGQQLAETEETTGWSLRSRGALRLLRDSFATVKEQELAAQGAAGEGAGERAGGDSAPALSLKGMLEGSSRREAARMYFETLVLSTRGCIKVVQQQPYGDIAIIPKAGMAGET